MSHASAFSNRSLGCDLQGVLELDFGDFLEGDSSKLGLRLEGVAFEPRQVTNLSYIACMHGFLLILEFLL